MNNLFMPKPRCAERLLSTLVLVLLLSTGKLQGQTLLDPNSRTGTLPAGQYSHPYNISLKHDFSFSATPGNNLQLLIKAEADCQNLNTTPSSNQNYVITYVPRDSTVTDLSTNGLKNLSNCKVMASIAYFDGLGRPLQNIQVKGSTNGFDVVQPFVYDAYGRESQKFLPYAVNSTSPGSYRDNALGEQADFYSNSYYGQSFAHNDFPWTPIVFEPSPLNRVVEQGAPGLAWQLAGSTGSPGVDGHTTKTAYGTNVDSEVKLWQVNSDGNGANWNNNYYAAGQLYKTTFADENAHQTIEYKDKQGHVVCKMVQKDNNGNSAATYYVYDDYQNLAYVIPPVSQGNYPQSFGEADNVFLNYVYAYHYDGRNRVVEKKLPGKGWEFMVYNTLDQVRLTQDANQRALPHQQWTMIKYDNLGRVILTAIYQDPNSPGDNNLSNPNREHRLWFQDYINSDLVLWENRDNTSATGYTNSNRINVDIAAYLTINYYDDYNFPGKPSNYSASASGISNNVNGLLTASKTAILKSDGTYGDMLWTVHYYDTKGQLRESYVQNHAGGYDHTVNDYSFTGKLTQSHRTHNTQWVQGLVINARYDYDHMDRKTNTWQKTGTDASAEVLLSQLAYDESGQLLHKRLHSTNQGGSFLQDVVYAYNERSWLTNITSNLFAMRLYYNAGDNAQFNGNIATQYWGTPGNLDKRYVYYYDPMNRLTAGNSETGNSENGIDYDDLGNIQHLTRTGVMNPGTFTYNYNGNQLKSVSGLTQSDYNYDANGNMTHDGRNSTDVAYNMLNLPRSVPGKNLTYTYDAAGQKLNKNNGSTSTDYIAGVQYENGDLKFVQSEEGRVLKNGADLTNNWNYEYNLSDHLGNSRRTFDQTSGTTAKQVDDYYPFGLEINTATSGAKNKYLYNKKELQDELNQYDYGARFYDPVIGRFSTIDRFAEKYAAMTPYQYGALNPIKNIDMNGDSVNFTLVQRYDKQNSTNITQNVKSDLNSETGLSLSYDKNGQLIYDKDPIYGNAIVNMEDDGYGGLREVGSATARDALTKAIDNTTTAYAKVAINSSAIVGGNLINLDPTQIGKFIAGSTNIDSRTLGFGMTFLHEMFHSILGGGLVDPPLSSGFGPTGATVNKMNLIRSELNQKGANFGQRTSYQATEFFPGTPPAYLPFSNNSLNSLQRGIVPANTDKFIKFIP
ncbi:RHS repeat-associated core domain-containing protein [Mucilaginibacter robiniae]|uniref:RHS repeat-associated core domain-containing protein n=1 Tax=Mucilaginibacter robiniae TaxID=2728022 RepID=A0A7L5DXC3_9SPHI|nr:DUF6443 domain-containing protein [Mucilaginibacter robiniae]QJD95750.1 RHS repeat-associated core domain-containing protein [Mucilaginibacter robiniae]